MQEVVLGCVSNIQKLKINETQGEMRRMCLCEFEKSFHISMWS